MFNVNDYKNWEQTYENILTNIKGFPKDTIIREYKINNNKIADIVIDINEPLAIIEIKAGKIDLNKTAEQLFDYINLLNSDIIEGYVVFFDNLPNNVKFYKLNKNSGELDPIKDIPNYSYFKSLKNKKIYNELYESNKIFDWIALIMGFSMIIYHIYLVFFSKIIIQTNQLIILIIGIGIIFLPFFSKIKITNIELERMPKSKQEEDIKNK